MYACRLYRSIGDYDVLRGIFAGHIGTKDITRKAMEAEARGDYSQALKLYNEVSKDRFHNHFLIRSSHISFSHIYSQTSNVLTISWTGHWN